MIRPMSHWPLFGLRIRTERLELRMPTDPDLFDLVVVARAGVHGPGEMPFLEPWTQTPSPDFERGFLQYHWSTRASWRPETWRLELGVLVDGQPAGAQAISADGFAEHRAISTGSWLGMGFHGRGYGKEMRSAVLGFAFDYLGAQWVSSAAFMDNAASIVSFLMTPELWRSRERAAIQVEGFEECREFFGA